MRMGISKKKKGEYEYEIHLLFPTKPQRYAWVRLIEQCMRLVDNMEEEE